MTKLVRRAVGGLQIRLHSDGAYQVIDAPVRADTTPLYTSRNLEHAETWRRGRIESRASRQPRDKLLTIRMSIDEMAAYEAAAVAARQSVSDYVRLVVGAHITLRGPVAAKRILFPAG